MRGEITTLIEEILNMPAGTINETTKAEDVEAWDSLAHVMIIGELENRLGIAIPLDEAGDIYSVEDIFKKAGV